MAIWYHFIARERLGSERVTRLAKKYEMDRVIFFDGRMVFNPFFGVQRDSTVNQMRFGWRELIDILGDTVDPLRI